MSGILAAEGIITLATEAAPLVEDVVAGVTTEVTDLTSGTTVTPAEEGAAVTALDTETATLEADIAAIPNGSPIPSGE
jgi:hypothetical protein